MAERETSQAIDEAAAAWAARQDRAPLSPEDTRALNEWLSGDVRRPGAFLRARAVALRSESAAALGSQFDPADFRERVQPASPPSRRRILAWGSGLAAGVAALSVLGVSLHAPSAYATDMGEIRLVPLDDGSAVTLNTATRVTVKYEDASRKVRLIEGEADFRVLANAQRPFVVEVGDSRLVVKGDGAFRIRKLDDGSLDILVHAGRVETMSDGSHQVVMGANTRLEVPAVSQARSLRPTPQEVSPSLMNRELAWREGKIAFEGETLAEAASAFARYSKTRIIIDDPVLSREPITGLFAANDPAGFSRAAASVFGAPVHERDGAVVIGVRRP